MVRLPLLVFCFFVLFCFDVRTDVKVCDCTRGAVRLPVKESALKVDFGNKTPCRTGESNLHQHRDGPGAEAAELHLHLGWGCSSVGRASDRHAADAGSIPRCGKGFFSQSQLSVQTRSLTVSVHPRAQSHAFTSVRTLKIPSSMSEFGGLWKH